MDYTKNYHLPQWKKEDRIMMEDFNQAMNSLEEGIGKAQNTADAAKNTADSAYTPNWKPYVVGTYTGTGAQMVFDLGFRPSFVIINGASGRTGSFVQYMGGYRLFSAGNTNSSVISFTDTGFVLQPANANYPNVCDNNLVYDYIAFR